MFLTAPGTWGVSADSDTALSVPRQAVHLHEIAELISLKSDLSS
ncbi:hypothetical protein ACH429_03620 [Streptomyces pathocidini]|uniref:Uncharacterized protein n=1 Tax=Streptomyces pathocidini TaxID=1650571 RepID=A0ABW7UKL8_9ACTN|nr:hypothetical protein [Streptomyces pathocidini]